MKYVAIWIFGVAVGGLTVATLLAPTATQMPAPPGGAASVDAADAGPDLSTDVAIAAYSIGYDLSTELEAGLELDGVEADDAAILAGFSDGLADRDPRPSPEEMSRVLADLHQKVMATTAEKLMEADPAYRELCESKLAASKAYMAENAKRDGVKTLESGAQVEVLAAAPDDAASPGLDDFVVCKYRGTLVDGTEFAAAKEGLIRVRETTAGAQKVLAKMKVGDHWRVVIPPELAHGPAGKPPLIGPNEALVFDVELLEIHKPEAETE